MKLCKIFLVSIITIVLSSCSSSTNLAEPSSIPTPDIGIPLQSKMYLEVTAPIGWNSFKTNEPISLMIRNVSDKQIMADQNFGARVFVLTSDKWAEVKDKTVYTDDPIVLEPTKNFDPMKVAGTFILPDLPDYSVRSYIRVFIVGTVLESGTESKEIATFIDLELNP